MKGLQESLTKGYLAFLEHFAVKIGTRINQSALSGQRKSGTKGSSMEFSDFREYTLGDDIRRIDWNSFARSEKLFTKVYLEEKQADINIFIDTSKSLGLYEEKGFYAKMIGASIAYIALKNNDKVNVFSWNNGLKEQKVNSISKNSFPSIVSFIDGLEFEGESGLRKAVEEALKTTRRGISFIISDMFVQGDLEDALKALTYKRQEIILIQVLDEKETEPDVLGSLRITDCETGEFKDVTVSAKMIEDYKKALYSMRAYLSEYCKGLGGRFISIDTKTDLKEAVKMIF